MLGSNSFGKNKAKPSIKVWKFIVPLLVMFLIIFEARSILKEIDLNEVWKLATAMNPINLVIFFVMAIAAVFCLCSYDYLLINYYDYGISTPKVYLVAWISGTFNNIVGFGGIIGAAIRTYMFKKEGIDVNKMISYNIILVPSTILGLGVLAILDAFNVLNTYELLAVYKWLWIPLMVFCIFVPIYFLLGKISWLNRLLGKFNLFFEGSFNIKLKFVICSTIDWLSRALLLYAISRSFKADVPVTAVIGIDSMAAVAGLISFIPSGLGSYDIVALMGFEILGYSANTALSIILLFRIFYFIIPWIIGGVIWILLMAVNFIKKK